MKKIIGIISITVLIFALSITCFAGFMSETVEITFKVGDSTLFVNGKDMTVETPYVVGAGVTLVPVRIITEAFGAVVDWNGKERKVTLTTDEKEVGLWIGKDAAIVDGKEIKLLSAPEISNDVTMVPLRFISENFGADVFYDNQTKEIKVMLEKGPVIKDGMKFFDDGYVAIPVPEEYVCVKENSALHYSFLKSQNYNYTDFDTLWTYSFVCESFDDIKKAINSDRALQVDNINDKNISVSAVKKNISDRVENYSYNIVYKKNSNSILRVKKNIYNFGNYSYFTISVYDSCFNTGNCVRDDKGIITGINFNSYNLTVLPEFQNADQPQITRFDTSGKASPEIEVLLYRKTDDFDAKAFLEAEEDSFRYEIEQRNTTTSRVKEYIFDNKTLYGYEVSYINGGKEYNLISSEEDYVAHFKFEEDNFDKAESVISDFKFNYSPDYIEKLPVLGEVTYTTVEADSLTFEIPSTFDIYQSLDKKVTFAVDRETSMVLSFYDDITTVANEEYDFARYVNPYTSPFQGTEIVTYIGSKKTLSEFTEDIINHYEMDAWETGGTKTFKRITYKNEDEMYPDIAVDSTTSSKSVANNVDIYQRGYYIFTDTDDYTMSQTDERIVKLNKAIVKNNLKDEYDMHDQNISGFIFTYTNLFNEKYIEDLFEKTIASIRIKNN